MSLEDFTKNAAPDTASAIAALAKAAVEIATLIRRHGVALGGDTGGVNADGDSQKALDVRAEDIIAKHLADSGAAMLLSEEQEKPLPLNNDGSVIVAVDPLDGSSNIDVNVSVGTIFSILPAEGGALQPGSNQLAAGFFVYGPQVTLIAALADGKTRAFVLDPDSGAFIMLDDAPEIPPATKEFAINAAYARSWLPPVAAWFNEVLEDGVWRQRWVGSLVADAFRIFRRGGIFLYPADSKNPAGRLRLVYEAAPMAFLAERAGGMATDGAGAILGITPDALHQRVPLVFGSRDAVMRLKSLHLT